MQLSRVILMLGIVNVTGAPVACGWGADGHQLVGAVADALIAGSPAASKVNSILGTETLQQASLWADCVKGTNEKKTPFKFTVDTKKFPKCKPFESATGVAAMVDYVKRNHDGCAPGPDQETCHKQYHYSDVAIQRSTYDSHDQGTSDHDIVASIRAAVVVLKGQPAPAPFNIKNKKEALRLLAHFVGDIHQPLHVGAVYLDHQGNVVDPDQPGFDPDSSTHGGNLIQQYCENLHHSWDDLPKTLRITAFKPQAITLAQLVPLTAGSPEDWPVAWAGESVVASQSAYSGLTYWEETSPGTSERKWQYLWPANYPTDREALQKEQLVKAGARLAQLLKAIWP
jgi:S1/P1 Nuclease